MNSASIIRSVWASRLTRWLAVPADTMKLPAACRRTTFVAVTGSIAAVAILASGTATAAVPASAAAAITTSTTLFAPDGKHAQVTITEIPAGDGEYNDAVSFIQVSAGVTNKVLADHSALETTTGAVTLYLTGVRVVQAAICDSSGCSMWWPSYGAPNSPRR